MCSKSFVSRSAKRSRPVGAHIERNIVVLERIMTINSIAQLPDSQLLATTLRAAADERKTTVDLLILIGEIDSRQIYLAEGCSSLFAYCTRILRFSEHEAYHRIEAARAMRLFPAILEPLRNGALTLTNVTLLRPHLKTENAEELITAAINKTRREVEQLVAGLAPKPDAKPIVRRLPDPQPVSAPTATTTPSTPPPSTPSPPTPLLSAATPSIQPAPRPITTPLAADRFLLRVTLTAVAHAKLRRAQDLMRHSIPNGDLAAIVDQALTVLVEDLERRKLAHVKKPRKTNSTSTSSANQAAVSNSSPSRHIPAAIRRAVWARDEGRCAYVGRRGRCEETGWLEFHHVEAFALGGPTSVANLELRCRAHNQFEGAMLFGPHADSGDRHTVG